MGSKLIEVNTKSDSGSFTEYMIQLPEKYNGHDAFVKMTGIIRQANRVDRKRDYDHLNGPNVGIEVQRALDYIDYVSQVATPDNLSRFNTARYTFIIDTEHEIAVAA